MRTEGTSTYQAREADELTWLAGREEQFRLLAFLQSLTLREDETEAERFRLLLRRLAPLFSILVGEFDELTLFCERLYALKSPEE